MVTEGWALRGVHSNIQVIILRGESRMIEEAVLIEEICQLIIPTVKKDVAQINKTIHSTLLVVQCLIQLFCIKEFCSLSVKFLMLYYDSNLFC